MSQDLGNPFCDAPRSSVQCANCSRDVNFVNGIHKPKCAALKGFAVQKYSKIPDASDGLANRGHSKALRVMTDIDKPGRLRVGHLQTLFAVSHSTLYSHIRAKLIPKPDGYDGRRPYWSTETIRKILAPQL